MLRVVVAPCSPFSVTADLMRQSAALARALGVRLHTHLAETIDEEQFCLEKFGHRPAAYMETLDWVGGDVWFAHSVHVNDAEIQMYAHTGCGVAHCPASNMRLASGIAPVVKYRAAGVKVGLGVDGSASNDGSHMLGEARQALLLARVLGDPGALTARQALELATLGGAAVLGRDDIGSLAPGKCADFFAINLNRLDYAGALHDPVAAVIFCAPQKADYTVIHGKVIVREGRLTTIEVPVVVERHNQIAREMV
jgi:cytosine/adenosine deaminase-related metal-dependent hydrolase